MRGDVVEVTIAIGDSIVTTGHAAGPFALDWAPEHVLVPPAERDVPVRTRIGLAEVTLTRVAAPERSLPYTSNVDRRAWRYLALSLGVHLLVWNVATTQPPAPDHQHRSHAQRPAPRYIRLPGPTRDLAITDPEAAPRLVPMFLDRPTAGTPPITALEPTAGGNHDIATTNTDDLVAAFTAPSLVAGAGESTVYSGSESTRGFGEERHSFSGGGGCTEEPCGTIGTLHYVPLGKTSNVGNGWGLMAHDHSAGPTCTLHLETATSTGDLGKLEIRRYIRDHLDQLTYCYEKGLLANPTLGGVLSLSFQIEASGHVESVVASGVSPEVEACVAGVIRSIEFPRAIGGGATQVNYPLTFHVAK